MPEHLADEVADEWGNDGTEHPGPGGAGGGIGIDFEFMESSMLFAVVSLGFMGLCPDGQTLHIEPNLPKDYPEMTVRNLLYQGVHLDEVSQVSALLGETVPRKRALRSHTTLFSGGAPSRALQLWPDALESLSDHRVSRARAL